MPSSRSMRAFLRWMHDAGIRYSDAVDFTKGGPASVRDWGVRALSDLSVGDLIATIPKRACVTLRTTEAADVLEEAGLAGHLGLAVAVMYERSLGERSRWFGYLQQIPVREDLPLVWSQEEVDLLLVGTELHQAVLQDRQVACHDWQQHIQPLCEAHPQEFPAPHFTLERYLDAKSAVSSRAFQIDGYHGFGLVPLADMFNHKTAAEDLGKETACDGERAEPSAAAGEGPRHGGGEEEEEEQQEGGEKGGSIGRDAEQEQEHEQEQEQEEEGEEGEEDGDDDTLQMVMVRDVAAGSEIFNTYGQLGTAALLDRYGFTDPVAGVPNPFDIVNVDMGLVLAACCATEPPPLSGSPLGLLPLSPLSSSVLSSSPSSRSLSRHAPNAHFREEEEEEEEEEGKRRGVGASRIPSSSLTVAPGLSAAASAGDEKAGKRKSLPQPDAGGRRRPLRRKFEEEEKEEEEEEERNGIPGGRTVSSSPPLHGSRKKARKKPRLQAAEGAEPSVEPQTDGGAQNGAKTGHHVHRQVSRRHARRCLRLWCEANSPPPPSGATLTMASIWQEYFEIDAQGKPQVELLLLLRLLHATDEEVSAFAAKLEGCAGDALKIATALGWQGLNAARMQRRVSESIESMSNTLEALAGEEGHGVEEVERGGDASFPADSTGDVYMWLATYSRLRMAMLAVLDLRDQAYHTGTRVSDEVVPLTLGEHASPHSYHATILRLNEREILARCKGKTIRGVFG
eukprot:jgi/Mesen1/3413/ME000192S02578